MDYQDGAIPRDVLLYIQHCASGWEPDVRILGNARADDVVRACEVAVEALAMLGQMQRRIAELIFDGTWSKLPGARTEGQYDEFEALKEYLERDLDFETPLADEIERMIFAFDWDDSRRHDIRRIARAVAQLERQTKKG